MQASEDGTARMWDTRTGTGEAIALLRHEKGTWASFFKEEGVRAATFSPSGDRVVTASEDGTARVWDAQTGKALGVPLRHANPVRAAAFSPDGQRGS